MWYKKYGEPIRKYEHVQLLNDLSAHYCPDRRSGYYITVEKSNGRMQIVHTDTVIKLYNEYYQFNLEIEGLLKDIADNSTYDAVKSYCEYHNPNYKFTEIFSITNANALDYCINAIDREVSDA